MNTKLFDINGEEICIYDKLNFLNMEGTVVFECGAFGIAFDNIDYDLIQYSMDIDQNCCGNSYEGCFNDNFISLWEIYWNFNCDEDFIHVVEILEKDNQHKDVGIVNFVINPSEVCAEYE